MSIERGPFTGTSRDDYLWDRREPVDAQVAHLERLLAPYALRADLHAPPATVVAAARARRPRAVAMAAVLACLMLGGYGWYWQRLQWAEGGGWETSLVAGQARLDDRPLRKTGVVLQPGSVVETDATGVARIEVASIGEAVLGQGSRLQLVQTRSGHHRVQLDHGTLWARIWAPPGSFGVGVPSGEAIDMGCEFLIRTDARGDGHLQVRSGWVQFEDAEAEIFVPQGARVVLRSSGVGTPYANDAAPEFIAALDVIDREGMHIAADAPAVRQLLGAARREDAITLLSLLSRYPQLRDGPVFDRLGVLLPAGVTRQALAEQGRNALNPWWRALPYPPMKRWWLKWPDAVSATGNAQSRLRHDPP